MATWVLTRGLMTVRTEFNLVFKIRDRRSDGSIGDQSHATGTSGHNPDRTGRAEYKDGDAKNEVRAIDVDRDLVPGSGIDWMERVVQFIIKKARAGGYVPFRYIIYKRRIWARSDGWKTRAYTGANAHDQHAHFSGDYTQKADEWTGTLGLASLLPDDGAGAGANEEDEGMDAAEFYASAAKAARGDADATAGDRTNRNNAVQVLRFALGLPVNEQSDIALPSGQRGQLTRIENALALLVSDGGVDEEALAEALAPKLDVNKDVVAAALREVLTEGVGQEQS